MSKNNDLLKALREELAANEGVRSELYELADDAAGVARAFARTSFADPTGEFERSIEARHVKFRKLGKRTKVAAVRSTDDPRKVAALEYGRDGDTENGAAPAFKIFERTAEVFNNPIED